MLTAAITTLLGAVAATAPGSGAWPARSWSAAAPADFGLDGKALRRARDYALRGGGAGMIVVHGRVVMAWGDLDKRFELKSTTKSIGVTALGLALGDGKLRLTDRAADRHPSFGVPPASNTETGWLGKITLLELATQTAGFAKPGGYEKLLFVPGRRWYYSDGGPNWLAEIVTLAYRRDLRDLLFERVFSRIGITGRDLTWRRNIYRPHEIEGIPRREFGSGIQANMNALARIGYLYLRGGVWRGRRLLPASFVERAGRPDPTVAGLPEWNSKSAGSAANHYGLLWWNNADGTLHNVPADAFWAWGLYDSLILVVPSLDLVAVRAGKAWQRHGWQSHYAVLEPFFEPIAAAFSGEAEVARRASGGANSADRRAAGDPPPSPVIAGLRWAPESTILRLGKGSDNWPLTWGADNALYTAWGDGRGFEPRTPQKLSLGFGRVDGHPPDLHAVNIRSANGEAVGDGRKGRKASGILMVNGVLYLWTRNVRSSQLGWSADRGKTWQWAPWRISGTFGCPTFLNFGRNYAGARDRYVYTYSPDAPDAYTPADRMVLARCPRDGITDRNAYEFFVRLDGSGVPEWSGDIRERGAVFRRARGCWRSGISWCAPLKRYLWCQTFPGKAPRFGGGFCVLDAPEPWGPWTLVWENRSWDVGPGETSSFPTKWMQADGRAMYLVFSGDDCFSVRRAEVLLRSDRPSLGRGGPTP
ncbi:MAG: serine hydrolase [Kiritimatiellaeota bacterium]|nr:serine hydrolase [Kiritimatiellota bacterium]